MEKAHLYVSLLQYTLVLSVYTSVLVFQVHYIIYWYLLKNCPLLLLRFLSLQITHVQLKLVSLINLPIYMQSSVRLTYTLKLCVKLHIGHKKLSNYSFWAILWLNISPFIFLKINSFNNSKEKERPFSA